MKKDLKFPIELGKRVREARKAKGYTIEHLAELADMAPQYISEVERGKKTFGAENLPTTLSTAAAATTPSGPSSPSGWPLWRRWTRSRPSSCWRAC